MIKREPKISIAPHELLILMGEAEAKELLWRLYKLRKDNKHAKNIQRLQTGR